jgi:FHA domain
MAESPASALTGDDIISELIRNVDVGLFKVGHTVLLPCRFNVYFHEHDFDLIHPITQVIRREAKQALTEHLDRLNKARPQPRFMKKLGLASSPTKPEYKILEKDWSVEFHRGEEDRLRPGELEIYSDLGTEQKAELGAGAKTTFVTRHTAEEPSAPDSVPGSRISSNPFSEPAFAMLRYSDQRGEKVFAMTRDEIVIGRGGKAVWVDLKLEGPADISREHCRIRRDADTGTFFVKDLSQYGTAVNGRAIPTSIERSEQGDRVDRNIEVPLPPFAKITLAEVLVIEFEAKHQA